MEILTDISVLITKLIVRSIHYIGGRFMIHIYEQIFSIRRISMKTEIQSLPYVTSQVCL